jgi:hypothetical protein
LGANAEPDEAGTDQEKGPWLRHGGDAGQITDKPTINERFGPISYLRIVTT